MQGCNGCFILLFLTILVGQLTKDITSQQIIQGGIHIVVLGIMIAGALILANTVKKMITDITSWWKEKYKGG